MILAVSNTLWLILIMTLAAKGRLTVLGTNPIGTRISLSLSLSSQRGDFPHFCLCVTKIDTRRRHAGDFPYLLSLYVTVHDTQFCLYNYPPTKGSGDLAMALAPSVCPLRVRAVTFQRASGY